MPSSKLHGSKTEALGSRACSWSVHGRAQLSVVGRSSGYRRQEFVKQLPNCPFNIPHLVSYPRPLHYCLLLCHGPPPLGLAGPCCAPTRLLGPGPELSVVPSRWASEWLVAGGDASSAAWRLEAVRTLPSPFHLRQRENGPVCTCSDLKAVTFQGHSPVWRGIQSISNGRGLRLTTPVTF